MNLDQIVENTVEIQNNGLQNSGLLHFWQNSFLTRHCEPKIADFCQNLLEKNSPLFWILTVSPKPRLKRHLIHRLERRVLPLCRRE